MRVIERLDYSPSGVARSLATNRTLTVGLVVPDITNPFFPEIARGVEDVVRKHGYEMFLCNSVEDPGHEEHVLRALEDKRVDGAIICSSRLPDGRSSRACASSGLQYSSTGWHHPNWQEP